MSYDPNRAYDPNQQARYRGGPGYPPPASPPPPVRTQQRPPRRSDNRNGFAVGCTSFILGFLVAALLAGVVVYFAYFYNANATQPLAKPANAPGTPDISATLSQQYLNTEISRQLPFKIQTLSLKDVTITVKDSAQLEIAMQANYANLADFNLTVTEQVTVESGQIKLNIVGQPRLLNGQLPPGITQLLQQVNAQFIEPKVNEQIKKIAFNGRPLQLTNVTSSPGLLTVQANVG